MSATGPVGSTWGERLRLLLTQAVLFLLAALLIGAVAAYARAVTAPLPEGRAAAHHVPEQASLEATRAHLLRATEILTYAAKYRITGELSAAIYDAALEEGIHPALAYQLVKVESRFDPQALSPRGAIGYTQIRLATARGYDPDLTTEDLLDPAVNLRLGFRFLRDLLRRFDGDLSLALVAYNRGPTLVRTLLAEGEDPGNGYAELVLRGVSRVVAAKPLKIKS